MTCVPTDERWTVVVPLKGGPDAKSRLRAPAALATAIALDCLAAVLACPAVSRALVVTPDPALGHQATSLGAEVIAESRPAGGLSAAVADGVRAATGWTAVLLGDLPALRPADLAIALTAARTELASVPAPEMVFLPDADGIGTVLLAGRGPQRLQPSFGPDAAAAHARSGAYRLELDLPRLRRDVDTAADLAAAVELGVGPRTLATMAGVQLPEPGRPARRCPTLA